MLVDTWAFSPMDLLAHVWIDSHTYAFSRMRLLTSESSPSRMDWLSHTCFLRHEPFHLCIYFLTYCFSLFMVSACYWRGRLCFGGVRDRGFVLYISLFFRVLGWWMGVCLYTHVHTHKLLGYLMWAQVWDGLLESQKNPDRLKRSIHVDRTGVHSTFVHIYAVLRVLMIWANCFFLLTVFSF